MYRHYLIEDLPLPRVVGELTRSNLADGPTPRGDMPDDILETKPEEILRPWIVNPPGTIRVRRDGTSLTSYSCFVLALCTRYRNPRAGTADWYGSDATHVEYNGIVEKL